MRLARLKAHALGHPGATATLQWDNDLVFKVAGKMFFVLGLDADTVESLSCKVTPADFQRLPRENDAWRPAPYLARASWLQLTDPAAVPEAEVRALITVSYELVRARLPAKVRAKLGG